MLRGIIIFIILLHAVIHLLGFAKAFRLAEINQLNQPVSKASGLLWLSATILFAVAAAMYLFKKDMWWLPSVIAIILSQSLIIAYWHDAKYGTLLNLIILTATIAGYGAWSYKSTYKHEVSAHLASTIPAPADLLQEADIAALPEPVKKYIRYSGALNKPKVKNFRACFDGQIRKKGASEWMKFSSEQYNFMEGATRLFFMTATMKGMPVAGFHCFKNGTAFMDIRLFSLFKVQYYTGKEMGIAETVTFFNDMCVLAPATLIDKRIEWKETDSNKVKATFSNNGITVSAWLYFNNKGELVNFTSDDRYAFSENNTMNRLPWSTPMKEYRDINGHRVSGYAETIYSYPDGDFCYGTFELKDLEYNCK